MKVKLGKSFIGNHARAGQVVDLPEAIAKAGVAKGLFTEVKKAPVKKATKKKATK